MVLIPSLNTPLTFPLDVYLFDKHYVQDIIISTLQILTYFSLIKAQEIDFFSTLSNCGPKRLGRMSKATRLVNGPPQT